jgi:hypothetical protein
MAVKVVVKGKKTEEQPANKVPAIRPPASPRPRENVITRILKIMLMDIRMKLDPQLRKDYNDYGRFCEIARGQR